MKINYFSWSCERTEATGQNTTSKSEETVTFRDRATNICLLGSEAAEL